MRAAAAVIASLVALAGCTSMTPRPLGQVPTDARSGEFIIGLHLAADASRLPALLRPEELSVVCQAGDFAQTTVRLVHCTAPGGAALSPEEMLRVRQGFAGRPEVAFVEFNLTATAQPR